MAAKSNKAGTIGFYPDSNEHTYVVRWVKEDNVLRYAVLVYYSVGDKSYIAEAPELQECMAWGISCEDAVSQIVPVMGEWIRNAKVLNREIPEPQGRLKVQVRG